MTPRPACLEGRFLSHGKKSQPQRLFRDFSRIREKFYFSAFARNLPVKGSGEAFLAVFGPFLGQNPKKFSNDPICRLKRIPSRLQNPAQYGDFVGPDPEALIWGHPSGFAYALFGKNLPKKGICKARAPGRVLGLTSFRGLFDPLTKPDFVGDLEFFAVGKWGSFENFRHFGGNRRFPPKSGQNALILAGFCGSISGRVGPRRSGFPAKMGLKGPFLPGSPKWAKFGPF